MAPTPVATAESDFWLACLEQLKIDLNQEILLTFAQLIASWRPRKSLSSSPQPSHSPLGHSGHDKIPGAS